MLKRVIPLSLVISALLSGCGGADSISTDSSSTETNHPEIAPTGAIKSKIAQGSDSTDLGSTTMDKTSVATTAEGLTPLIANDDYVMVASDDDTELSVSDNDIYTQGETNFEVVEYPKEGELVMDLEGGFIYHPNNGFTGVDSFTYTAHDGVSAQQATVTVDVTSSPHSPAEGFTEVKPSADSQLIYVSSSMGADGNDCLSPSAPCESLEAALSKVRPDSPDHVYLKRGDVWRDQKLSGLKSGRSADEPAVVSFYGNSGDRPKIEHSDSIISLTGGDRTVEYLHIIGLHFDAYRMDIEDPNFSGTNDDHATLTFLGDNSDVLLEDNLFHHLEVVIQAFDGQNPRNFRLRRNIWTGAYGDTSSYNQGLRPSNIYADGVDGLHIEENVFDHGGWHQEAEGAAGNMYNHNLYLQSENNGERVLLRNNIITRGASHGAQMRAGGLAEDNFFGRNAIGLLMGYSKKPLKDGVKAHALNNVITEGASMVKGTKPCSGTNLCTPAQFGLDFDINGNADWVAKGNVVHSLDESNNTWRQEYAELVSMAFKGIDDPSVDASDNVQSQWGEEVLDGVAEVVAPAPTLGEYYIQLVQEGAIAEPPNGEDDFDRFMTVVKSRGLQQWDERLTAKAINEFIRGGIAL